jgi:Ca2+-binding RTX toxin-like protein
LPLSLRGLGVAAGIAIAVLVTSTAQAATLTVDAAGNYVYTAGAGQANDLSVFGDSGTSLTVQEQNGADTIAVTAPNPTDCTGNNSTFVSCSIVPTDVIVNLEPAYESISDKSNGAGVDRDLITFNGGAGADTMAGRATLNGGDGNDLLGGFAPGQPNGYSSYQNGGNGNDTMMRGDQTIDFTGGAGEDIVEYYSSAIWVTIDGVANDGPGTPSAPGTDNIATDVENIRGTAQPDIINGTAGFSNVSNDLYGGEGDDILNGLDGADTFDGGKGADTFNGGNGSDMIDYSNRAAPLLVTIDTVAKDGEAGENDLVSVDVEGVTGGYSNDVIIGPQVLPAVDNVFRGYGGDDTIQGGQGADDIGGGGGQDQIDGQADNDVIDGYTGSDVIDGGAGNDTITGWLGFDRLDGGTGTDTVNGNDGADEIYIRDGVADTANCGTGTDTVVRDAAGDTINADCETSDTVFEGTSMPAAPLLAPAAAAAAPALAPAAVAPISVTVSCRAARRGSGITCRLSFGGGTPGTVSARLTRGGRTYAVARKRITGKRARLKLRSVRRARRGAYTLRLRDAGGKTIANLRVAVR